jgi:hypothetical protein
VNVFLDSGPAEPPNSQTHFDFTGKSFERLERVMGIEPTYSAWKAAALPLSYTRGSAISALCSEFFRNRKRH